jgi:hypothetical protein
MSAGSPLKASPSTNTWIGGIKRTVAADALGRERHALLREELPERVRIVDRGLVCTRPVGSCVCSGEIQGSAQPGSMPPYVGPR